MQINKEVAGASEGWPVKGKDPMTTGVVLVTGGSRGIGAAIVRGAAARGHRVAFSSSPMRAP